MEGTFFLDFSLKLMYARLVFRFMLEFFQKKFFFRIAQEGAVMTLNFIKGRR